MAQDRVLKSETEISSLAFTKDGKSLAAFGRDGAVHVFDLASGNAKAKHTRDPGDSGPMFLPSRSQFAVVGKDGGVRLRDLESGAIQGSLAIPAPRVSGIVASADGKWLAATSRAADSESANLVRVVEAATGRPHFQVAAGLGGISAIAFSPDGQSLVAGAYDTDVRVWNARNGELIKVVTELTLAMFEMVFSPDGKLLAAAGVDRVVYLWDTRDWRLLRKLAGQPEMISAMDISSDGKLIATGGMNEMAFGAPVKVILWDTASGKPVRTVDAEHRVNVTAFSPDGRWLAVADGSKSVRLWSSAA